LAPEGVDSAEFAWLVDRQACQRGEKAWKRIILSELGRIDDDDALRNVARQICALKPRTRDESSADGGPERRLLRTASNSAGRSPN
jgi:hypothetical protein